jgi:oxygen-dependent protoporphyrinogen oxidase
MEAKRIAIIGGGIAGLAAGFYVRQKFGDDVELKIYERENRLGGTIGVTRENGFIIDWGPNGFLDREPLTLEFIDQIGLKDQLLPADIKSERRFIYRNRKLWEISANPKKFMTSALLSLRGRLRIALEYFIAPNLSDNQESIFDFASRRIGREAAEILIDPMVSGIYGGDAEELELGACFPVMEKMEREYGGLIKAMIKKRKAAKGQAKSGGPAGPSGHLTSFKGGLFTLITHLEKLLKEDIVYPCGVDRITKVNNGYMLNTSSEEAEYDFVILAVPSYISSRLLAGLDNGLSGQLGDIPYSNLAVVCQGYKLADVGRPLDGFGFLVPHNQQKRILGSIWTSVIFPEQAPAGHALFRTMLGGAKNNDIIDLGKEELARIAHAELTSILRLKEKPVFERVVIWDKAIPQYVRGHRQRMAKIDDRLRNLGGIYLAGNAYTGIGLNDTIKRSYNIVESIKL